MNTKSSQCNFFLLNETEKKVKNQQVQTSTDCGGLSHRCCDFKKSGNSSRPRGLDLTLKNTKSSQCNIFLLGLNQTEKKNVQNQHVQTSTDCRCCDTKESGHISRGQCIGLGLIAKNTKSSQCNFFLLNETEKTVKNQQFQNCGGLIHMPCDSKKSVNDNCSNLLSILKPIRPKPPSEHLSILRETLVCSSVGEPKRNCWSVMKNASTQCALGTHVPLRWKDKDVKATLSKKNVENQYVQTYIKFGVNERCTYCDRKKRANASTQCALGLAAQVPGPGPPLALKVKARAESLAKAMLFKEKKLKNQHSQTSEWAPSECGLKQTCDRSKTANASTQCALGLKIPGDKPMQLKSTYNSKENRNEINLGLNHIERKIRSTFCSLLRVIEEDLHLSTSLNCVFRETTGGEYAVIITNSRNLGIPGEDLDPIRVVIRDSGKCSTFIPFRPVQITNVVLKCRPTLLQENLKTVLEMISDPCYAFCPGIKLLSTNEQVPKYVTVFSHPFPRAQAIDCPVWYKREDSKWTVVQCPACLESSNGTVTGTKRKRHHTRQIKRSRVCGRYTESQSEELDTLDFCKILSFLNAYYM